MLKEIVFCIFELNDDDEDLLFICFERKFFEALYIIKSQSSWVFKLYDLYYPVKLIHHHIENMSLSSIEAINSSYRAQTCVNYYTRDVDRSGGIDYIIKNNGPMPPVSSLVRTSSRESFPVR